MRKTCLIHQQTGIGDIIFIQKIIKSYCARDFNVICPIRFEHRAATDYLAAEHTHYPLLSADLQQVENFDFAHEHAYLVGQCETHIGDTLFTTPIATGDFVFLPLAVNWKLMANGNMWSKYEMAGIDWSDWQDFVTINRNREAENSLLRLLGIDKGKPYTLINEYSSNGRIPIKDPGDAIYMRQIHRYTLFDWIAVLEGCSRLITVDTSVVFLAEAFLKKSVPAYLTSKLPAGHPSYWSLELVLRLPWIFAPRASDLKIED